VNYYLKSWRISAASNRNLQKDIKELVEGFTIKSVMALARMNYEDCLRKYEKESEMTLYEIYERIFLLSTCYFTIAT
jgi:hypothetical protein